MTSLAINSGELGESEGASSRIEIVGAVIDEARVKTWGKGLKTFDGIERASVGVKAVGGSYLERESINRTRIENSR